MGCCPYRTSRQAVRLTAGGRRDVRSGVRRHSSWPGIAPTGAGRRADQSCPNRATECHPPLANRGIGSTWGRTGARDERVAQRDMSGSYGVQLLYLPFWLGCTHLPAAPAARLASQDAPAIAAGLTDHRWTVDEPLVLQVPPLRKEHEKRRGRPSNAMKALIAKWCT